MRYAMSLVMTVVMVAGAYFGRGWLQRQAAEQAQERATEAQEAAQRAQDPASDPGLTAAEREDVRLSQKLQPYIQALNAGSQPAHRAMRGYLRAVDPKAGPTLNKRGSVNVWVGTIPDPKRHVTAMDGVAESAPARPELQVAGERYGQALTALRAVASKAARYYKEKDWKDDDLKAGRALHPKLMAAYEAFVAADRALSALVDVENGALKERRLAMLERRYGRGLRFLTSNLMHQARRLVGTADVEGPQALALKTYTARLRAFQSARSELVGYIEGHPDEAGRVSLLSSMVSDAANFAAASKELMRRSRDGKEFTSSEAKRIERGDAERIDGHPAKVLRAYNDLVSSSNRLTFRG